MSKAKKKIVSAPGSDEAAAKRIMEASEARRNAFLMHMNQNVPQLTQVIDRIAWEAFKAGEKFGRGA